MTLLQLSLVVAASILLVSSQQQTLPPLVLPPTNDGSVCPADVDREMAQDAISSSVQERLQQLASLPQCGDGLWYRIGFLNMSDPDMNCPPVWSEYTARPERSCGRPTSTVGSCVSNFYPPTSPYSKVCGRALGYHSGTPDGFQGNIDSIDGIYVDGLSITYGSPRSHIWSFSSGSCACDNPNRAAFVGSNYFCEFGPFDQDDPLWDGEGCVTATHNGDCECMVNNPPWFSVGFTEATSDDIEVRICANEATSSEDVPILLLEIYVQ